MTVDRYEPELGQAIFGNPTGDHALPAMVSLAFEGIRGDIEIAYWNRFQREFEPGLPLVKGEIPGIAWRPYWWGDEDAPEASLPNLTFEDVEIRWYKHFGRGMSCNVEMTPDRWFAFIARMKHHISRISMDHIGTVDDGDDGSIGKVDD
jgi:hypothetical protein